jgi:hypothetical protein
MHRSLIFLHVLDPALEPRKNPPDGPSESGPLLYCNVVSMYYTVIPRNAYGLACDLTIYTHGVHSVEASGIKALSVPWPSARRIQLQGRNSRIHLDTFSRIVLIVNCIYNMPCNIENELCA